MNGGSACSALETILFTKAFTLTSYKSAFMAENKRSKKSSLLFLKINIYRCLLLENLEEQAKEGIF